MYSRYIHPSTSAPRHFRGRVLRPLPRHPPYWYLARRSSGRRMTTSEMADTAQAAPSKRLPRATALHLVEMTMIGDRMPPFISASKDFLLLPAWKNRKGFAKSLIESYSISRREKKKKKNIHPTTQHRPMVDFLPAFRPGRPPSFAAVHIFSQSIMAFVLRSLSYSIARN